MLFRRRTALPSAELTYNALFFFALFPSSPFPQEVTFRTVLVLHLRLSGPLEPFLSLSGHLPLGRPAESPLVSVLLLLELRRSTTPLSTRLLLS